MRKGFARMHQGRIVVIIIALALLIGVVISAGSGAFSAHAQRASSSFTVEQIKSYPFPNELTAAATGARIAWVFNEQGRRNIWVAEGPDFKARQLTNYSAAGVDIHGVHNWTAERAQPLLENRYEKAPDTQRALDVAWQSSPVSSIDQWKSPVLLIHGDDDRNVRFSQTTDLVRRLEKAGVPFEEIVIPDDTHHFLRHENSVKVNAAVAAFFDRVFRVGK